MSMEFMAMLITMIGNGITLAELMLNGQRNQRAEIQTLREEIINLRERMARPEGLLEGLCEAITITVRRTALAEAVAEEAGQYEQG